MGRKEEKKNQEKKTIKYISPSCIIYILQIFPDCILCSLLGIGNQTLNMKEKLPSPSWSFTLLYMFSQDYLFYN